MRIFQGMIDIANQAGSSAIGLRTRGHDVTLAVFESNKFSATKADLVLYPQGRPPRLVRWLRSLLFAHRQMLDHDIFHFHYKASMLPYNLDIPALRLRGKRVFMEFHGSDIRQGAPWTQGNPQASLYDGYQANPMIEQQVNKLCSMVDGIIVHDDELALYLPQEAPVSYIPLRVDVQAMQPRYPDPECKCPLIVHIPSHSGIKGTRYVKETIELLARDYDFEFVAPERIPHAAAQALLSSADIVIDQLILGVYGVLSIESMALGKPVIDFLRADMISQYPTGMPVINASREDLYTVLAGLLSSPHRLNEIGKAGRAYVERYHDCVRVAALLEQVYKGDVSGASSVSTAFETVGEQR